MSYIQKRGKNTAWKTSLMRNLVTELVVHEKLTITEMRAKELRSHFDKLVTLAKRQDLHARRQAARVLRNISADKENTALQKLFSTLALRYKERQGGYTQLFKVENRKGDNAPMVLIQLVK